MNPQEIRTLKLLEAIEADYRPSQRDLARQLDVSLGLINSFIKRLARKGYFKITHIPKHRARYVLTPKGAIEKTRLTCEYIAYSVSFYREARQRLQNLFSDMKKRGERSVIFFGVSELTEIAYISMQEFGIHLEAIVDEDPRVQTLLGVTVKTPDQVKWTGKIPVLITELKQGPDSSDRLLTLGVDAGRILQLL